MMMTTMTMKTTITTTEIDLIQESGCGTDVPGRFFYVYLSGCLP
ncbi:MAG: hypothetical protein RL177_448 [Bacteroidota bacterium]